MLEGFGRSQLHKIYRFLGVQPQPGSQLFVLFQQVVQLELQTVDVLRQVLHVAVADADLLLAFLDLVDGFGETVLTLKILIVWEIRLIVELNLVKHYSKTLNVTRHTKRYIKQGQKFEEIRESILAKILASRFAGIQVDSHKIKVYNTISHNRAGESKDSHKILCGFSQDTTKFYPCLRVATTKKGFFASF